MGLVMVPAVMATVIVAGALFVPTGPVVAVVVAVVIGTAIGMLTWRWAPSAVLRALGARDADEDAWPRPYNLVDGLCATMGLPPPALVVVDEHTPGAMAVATGASSATLVLTSGLLERLGPVELEGVLAHELSHVKHGDAAVSTVAAALLLPAARIGDPGELVHRLRGRGLELATDQRAVAVTRYPPGLRAGLAIMAEAVSGTAAGDGSSPGAGLWSTPAGRATRWLWTVPLGPAPDADALVGELDAADVRMAALDEH